MLYGEVKPAHDGKGTRELARILSASVDGKANAKEFRSEVAEMVTVLTKLRATPSTQPEAAESRQRIDDALELLRKATR